MFAVLIVAPFRVIFGFPTYCFSYMYSNVLPHRSGSNENARVGSFGSSSGFPFGAVIALRKFGWTSGMHCSFWRFGCDAPKPRLRGICYLRKQGRPGVQGAGVVHLPENACERCAPKCAEIDAGILALTAPRQLRPRATARILANITGTTPAPAPAAADAGPTSAYLHNNPAYRLAPRHAPRAAGTAAHWHNITVLPLGPCARLRPAQEPLCRRANTTGNRSTRPPAAPASESLRRNDTHRPRVLLRRRAAHSGQ